MGKFDERYKIYMDITAQSSWEWNDDTNATWVEIFADISEFTKSLVDKELFLRYKWDIITFKNRPYQSESLYNTIEGLSITQEIRIKLVSDNNTIRGYFGNNDCDYDDDNKFLTVTPAILDKYTEILENADEKIDIIGIGNAKTGNFGLDTDNTILAVTHNVPLAITSSNVTELQHPSTSALPNAGGAFMASAKFNYSAKFSLVIAAVTNITAGHTMKFYIREYNSSNSLLQEDLLFTVESGTSSSVTLLAISEIETVAGSYITLECVMSNPGDTITYGNLLFTANFFVLTYDTVTVQVNLIAEQLINIPVWTEMLHGRASPKYTEWEATNGVDDYFDAVTGAPILAGRFDDLAFGPATQSGAKFNNGWDVQNESIEGLRLSDLESALGGFEYELSQARVYKGGFYREWWPFGARKRRVFAPCSFSRDEYWKIDEGAPDPPTPGVGWVSTESFSGGKRLWIRKPFNGAYASTWTLGTKNISGGVNSAFEWQEYLGTTKTYPTGTNSKSFDTVRTLYEVIKTIFNNASPLLADKDVISTFFFNDNEASLPFYDGQATGTNYVTLDNPNILNRIGLIHTQDFNTTDTELNKDDQKLELSFNDIISDLRKFFPIYWFIDASGNLRIEHIKYLDLKLITVDVRGNPLIDETLKWKYDKALMFATINYKTANAGYVDFTNNVTKFDKIASNKRNQDLRLELQAEYLSTDIKYCIENYTDLDNGLVMIAYDSNNIMINADVPILGRAFENGAMAISNLLINYWRYEGIWETGKINNVDYEFTETARTKIGKEINLKNIYDIDGSGNEIAFVTTKIGVGMIKTMVHDFNRGITTGVILKYRYNSSPDASGFQLITMTDSLFNFGNYEN